jgi:Fic family protein
MIELRDTGTMTSPFLKAAHLQHLFSAIHPFADGNGRVSRLIASQPLLAAGFPPIMVKSERKSEYYTALREVRPLSSLTTSLSI